MKWIILNKLYHLNNAQVQYNIRESEEQTWKVNRRLIAQDNSELKCNLGAALDAKHRHLEVNPKMEKVFQNIMKV